MAVGNVSTDEGEILIGAPILKDFSRWSFKGQDPFLSTTDPVKNDLSFDLPEAKFEIKLQPLNAATTLKPLSRFSWKSPDSSGALKHTSIDYTPSKNQAASQKKSTFTDLATKKPLQTSPISATETPLYQNTKKSGHHAEHNVTHKEKDIFPGVTDNFIFEEMRLRDFRKILVSETDIDGEASLSESGSEPSTPCVSERSSSSDTPFTPATEYDDFEELADLFPLFDGDSPPPEKVRLQPPTSEVNTTPSRDPDFIKENGEVIEGAGCYKPYCPRQIARQKRKTMLKKHVYAHNGALAEIIKDSGAKTVDNWIDSALSIGNPNHAFNPRGRKF